MNGSFLRRTVAVFAATGIAAGLALVPTTANADLGPAIQLVVKDDFNRPAATPGLGVASTLGGQWAVNNNIADEPPMLTGTTGSSARFLGIPAGRTVEAYLPNSAKELNTETSSLQLIGGSDQVATYSHLARRNINGATFYAARLTLDPGATPVLSFTKRLSAAVAEQPIGSGVAVKNTGAVVAGLRYHFVSTVTGVNPTTLRAKVWADGYPEPANWQYTVTDSSIDTVGTASVRVVAGINSAPAQVRFDDFTVYSTD